jgi:hypothetical protein
MLTRSAEASRLSGRCSPPAADADVARRRPRTPSLLGAWSRCAPRQRQRCEPSDTSSSRSSSASMCPTNAAASRVPDPEQQLPARDEQLIA